MSQYVYLIWNLLKKYGNFIQFYNARQKKDPNVIPVLANKSQEIDSKNHFEKLEKKSTTWQEIGK